MGGFSTALTNDQIFHNYFQEDKDKKIEELCAAYREKLYSFMNNVEEQTEDLSGKIQVIVDNVRKVESEVQKHSWYRKPHN
ncbi:Protein FAR1-RELATED SEQUENCE 5 [Quillaja saponaria]|uniref:Protein FAR1-RELATED SEQUENCE 5 n=1 Tax=Quillaja saponaria TaxID=32244 RepID=A0AAD7PD07_QUISA|nr:Protein FAR1-RELATED SEQUENCE 5 [Quillaja saponaria]